MFQTLGQNVELMEGWSNHFHKLKNIQIYTFKKKLIPFFKNKLSKKEGGCSWDKISRWRRQQGCEKLGG
jgi:hypothetical protein